MPINMQVEYPKLQAQNIQLKIEINHLKSTNKILIETLESFRMLHLDNENNYPKGTIGYGLAKKLESALKLN